MSVAKLRKGGLTGKILLLVGPPGVGKSSIGRAVASCMKREFARVSLGGESDVAVLKGHMRTYLGSYPGKIVKALLQAKTMNPVILLDEVDKLGSSFKGSLSDALLELLDPQHNVSFHDNYLDLPLDLSQVLFICTANTVQGLHPALMDRTLVLTLHSYTSEQKEIIMMNHILPKITT